MERLEGRSKALRATERRHVPYILTRGSRPEAVLISYEQYLRFVQAGESDVLDRLDRALARMAVLNAAYSDEGIEADLMQATETVRTKRRKG